MRKRKTRNRSERKSKQHAKRQESPRRHSRSKRKTLQGKVQKNPKGFAFLIPFDPGAEDAYVPREDAYPLLNGDTVEYTVQRRGSRSYAQVQRILERGHSELIGTVERGDRGFWIRTSEGEGLPLRGKELTTGTWVRAEIDEYPTYSHPGNALVVEVLGPRLLPRHDLTVAIARYGLPDHFSENTEKDALQSRARALQEVEHPHDRKDLRAVPLVTIDGEDAKDFDDAVAVVVPPKGPAAFILYVAIADVSFFVRPGTSLDRDALDRGTSVYFPGVAIPMLPETLSNDQCSLRPQSDRLALTAEMHLDRDGRVLHSDFYQATIRTHARLTYNQVQAHFDHKPEPITVPLDEPLQRAHALYRKLLLQRKARGVLDFELPECKIEVDGQGVPTSVHRAARHESHRLIEEFMILANSEVAKALREARVGALYRVHEAPSPASLDDINLMLRGLGITQRMKDLTPISFAKVLESTASLKGAAALHQSILRLQKQAHYEPNPLGHFGLALSDYAHFTSPIRRYPDLVVHRSLKNLIFHRRNSDKESDEEGSLTQLGILTSEKERRAVDAERFVVRRKQCWYLEKRLGEVFQGQISGVSSQGTFVTITELATDGYLPLEAMLASYEIDVERKCLRQRPGHHVLSIGDPLTVQLTRVSVEDGEVTFAEVKE